MVTNKFPGISYKNQGRDFDFFEKLDISTTTFGGGSVDGYQPDIIITFPTKGLIFSMEGAVGNIVEYSFNGTTVHGELIPDSGRATLSFANRRASLIWFRVKSRSAGPITVSVEASMLGYEILNTYSPTPPPIPFDPTTDWSSTTLWLKSTDGVTQSGTVSLWEDQSGHSRNFSQATSSLQPIYNFSDSRFNGLPSIESDGVDDYLGGPGTASLVSASSFTVIIVISIDSSSAPQQVGYDESGIFGDTIGFWGLFTNSNAGVCSYCWDGSAKNARKAIDFNTTYIVAYRCDGVNSYISVNGGNERYIACTGIQARNGLTNIFKAYSTCSKVAIAEVVTSSIDEGEAAVDDAVTKLKYKYGIGNLIWNPLDIGTDLKLFCYAESNSDFIFSSGSSISVWKDRTANGNDLIQSTGSKQPLFSTTGWVGSVGAVTFDGINDQLETPTLTIGAFTVFMLGAMRNASFFIVQANTTAQAYSFMYDTRTEISRPITGISQKIFPAGIADPTYTRPKRLVWDFNGTHASNKIALNSVPLILTDGGSNSDPGTNPTSSKWYLSGDQGSILCANMDVRAYGIVNRALTPTETTNLYKWLTENG